MARRRGKSSSKQDDSWLPPESPVGQSSRSLPFNEYVIPGVLLLIIAVGGSGLGWVCTDHQQMIASLTETLESMQARITQLQQQLGPDNPQLTTVNDFEARLLALEDAYTTAQKQVELALATSEQIKSKDLQNKVWSLQTEMNNKLAELEQNTVSIAALNDIIKNKTVEFEVVKQSLNTMLSTNTELAIQIAGFSSTLSVTKLRLDEQISVVAGLMSNLEGQKMEMNEIKEIFSRNQETLAINTQELMDIKELVESEQIKRTQKIEKQLKSLYKRLDDHQITTESLHFHLAAQLEALKIEVLPGVQRVSRAEEDILVEEQTSVSDSKDKNTEMSEEDRAKGKDEFSTEQEAVEKVEAGKRPEKEPVKEMKTPLEELDNEIEKDVAEGHKGEVQNAFKNLDLVTVETVDIINEKVEKPVREEIRSHSKKANTNKTEKQPEVSGVGTIQALLDNSDTTTAKEEDAGEEQVKLTQALEMQTGLQDGEKLSDIINEDAEEERAVEHAAKEIGRDGTAEQEDGTAVDGMIISDDTTTNVNVGEHMTDIISEVEQQVEEELATVPAKKGL